MNYIGQKFSIYPPPKVILWCNKNNCHLEKDGNVYIIVENPKIEVVEIHTYSKFRIWENTIEIPFNLPDGTLTTVWDAFEQFLIDSRLRVGYEMLDVLEDDNKFFKLFYPKACEAFGQSLVDSILEKSLIKTEVKEK